jgi:hypothetical protein
VRGKHAGLLLTGSVFPPPPQGGRGKERASEG